MTEPFPTRDHVEYGSDGNGVDDGDDDNIALVSCETHKDAMLLDRHQGHWCDIRM